MDFPYNPILGLGLRPSILLNREGSGFLGKHKTRPFRKTPGQRRLIENQELKWPEGRLTVEYMDHLPTFR